VAVVPADGLLDPVPHLPERDPSFVWASGPGSGRRVRRRRKRPRARTERTSRLRLKVKDLEDPRRTEPPKDGLGEREMLEAWLEFHRATLLLKCEGADDHARKARPVATSRLSLHGLVRHMAEVERSWFRRVLQREPGAPYLWYDPAIEDSEMAALDGAVWEADLAAWQAECQASREAAAARSLSDTGLTRTGEPCSLRWIYVHMIEEYARHDGHADLIRELTGGAVGWQAQQEPAGACPSATSPAGHGPGKRRPRVPPRGYPGSGPAAWMPHRTRNRVSRACIADMRGPAGRASARHVVKPYTA
jgi:uncharacterized damage-inducible protein DinB